MVPDKVKIPLPALVKDPDPEIVPLNSWSFVSPVVKVTELAISIVPAPSREVIVSLASTSYTAPDATVTAVLSDNVPETVKVPAEIVVLPV